MADNERVKILSIQSSVAYGHVGNSAAVFPLQRLGHEVWPVLTVNFSNHTGYGDWRGPLIDPIDVAEVITGIEERGALTVCDAVLSGFSSVGVGGGSTVASGASVSDGDGASVGAAVMGRVPRLHPARSRGRRARREDLHPGMAAPFAQEQQESAFEVLVATMLSAQTRDAVTAAASRRLAEVSKALERSHPPEEVAHFLMRCIFTFFAEDARLIESQQPDEQPFTQHLRD